MEKDKFSYIYQDKESRKGKLESYQYAEGRKAVEKKKRKMIEIQGCSMKTEEMRFKAQTEELALNRRYTPFIETSEERKERIAQMN